MHETPSGKTNPNGEVKVLQNWCMSYKTIISSYRFQFIMHVFQNLFRIYIVHAGDSCVCGRQSQECGGEHYLEMC